MIVPHSELQDLLIPFLLNRLWLFTDYLRLTSQAPGIHDVVVFLNIKNLSIKTIYIIYSTQYLRLMYVNHNFLQSFNNFFIFFLRKLMVLVSGLHPWLLVPSKFLLLFIKILIHERLIVIEFTSCTSRRMMYKSIPQECVQSLLFYTLYVVDIII